jgi:FKBP-type peptidyl-prolyl cis-trans isomerase FklB
MSPNALPSSSKANNEAEESTMLKLKWLTVMGLGLLVSQAGADEMPVLKTRQDMVSYGIGVNIAKSFKKDDIEFNMELLIRGMKDGLSGDKLLIPEKDLRQVMNSFQGELRRKAMIQHQTAAEENKKKGEVFLAENKSKEGVVTLPSGVQYKVLKAGDGKRPTDGDTIECEYRGTLLSGTEFDGTQAGKPASLKIEDLIAGWKEVVKLMPVGSKWQLFIPSQLAYGVRGVGSDIGPNETLVFEVALLDIK